MSANLKKDILEAAKRCNDKAQTSFRFKQGDESLNTTMWIEDDNGKVRISLETYRRYQGQWCSTIRLTIDEAKILQKQLTMLINNANTSTLEMVDFGKPSLS